MSNTVKPIITIVNKRYIGNTRITLTQIAEATARPGSTDNRASEASGGGVDNNEEEIEEGEGDTRCLRIHTRYQREL